MTKGSGFLLLQRLASASAGATAVVTSSGNAYTYGALLQSAEVLASSLTQRLPQHLQGPHGPRVGLWAEPGPEYVAATWGIWQAGGIPVPLAVTHPQAELDYVCCDAGVSAVVGPCSAEPKLARLASKHSAALCIADSPAPDCDAAARSAPAPGRGTGQAGSDPRASADPGVSHSCPPGVPGGGSSHVESGALDGSDAWAHDHLRMLASGDGGCSAAPAGSLLIYTSGTTGRPKGALQTHRSIAAQVSGLATAWRMGTADRVLHCLPLHHIHGIVNAMYLPLAAHGSVEFGPTGRFNPAAVWAQIMAGRVSVVMGVPTMYAALLDHHREGMDPAAQQAAAAATSALRLAVCGSSACPTPLMSRWHALSGQLLLERYGMTETGMVLSNPYQGVRRPGSVGTPLPGVEVRVDAGGQLLVRGPTLFSQYWGRPLATQEAFDAHGYFATGDTVSLSGSPPYYSVEGRTSVDILKTAGYKVSALQVESVVLQHARVAEAAVVGLPDDKYGQVIAALLTPAPPAGSAHLRPPQPDTQAHSSSNHDSRGGVSDPAAASSDLLPSTASVSAGSAGFGSADGGVRGAAATACGQADMAPNGPPTLTAGELLRVSELPSAAELRAHCLTHLAPYKVPRRWLWLVAIPRNAMGKVNKRALVEQLQRGELQAAEALSARSPP